MGFAGRSITLVFLGCCFGSTLVHAVPDSTTSTREQQIQDSLVFIGPAQEKEPKQTFVMDKLYKEKLRALLALQFNDSFQIGLDSFKISGSEIHRIEMASFEPALHPQGGNNLNARGYGFRVKLKLD
jgi:hypothetical protein